jgi:hypothetical protein
VAVAVGLAGVLLLVVSSRRRKRRSERLREQFGPEYERVVAARGRRQGEGELEARTARRDRLEIHPLENGLGDRYREVWEDLQARFVEMPAATVGQANGLVIDVMRDRGYPIDDFDQRAADISVDHPHLVENYRLARGVAVANDEGRASTEDLRQAMVHFGAVLDELLDLESGQPAEASSSTSALSDPVPPTHHP